MTDPCTPAPDAGSTDSGTDIPDSGTVTPDSGTDIPDSGTDIPDSGTDVPDAGDFLVLKDGITYYSRKGIEPRPADFSTSPPQLILDDGGTPVFLPGTVTQPGTVRFDVPPGSYLIKHSNLIYVQTARRTVDLGYLRAGRPDRGGNPVPSTSAYPATLELSGLQPLHLDPPYANNSFSFYSMDLEEVGTFTLSATLSRGQTGLTDPNARYYTNYGSIPRYDPAQQDSAWLLQTEGRDAGAPEGAIDPWAYQTVVAAAHLNPFSFTGEGPLTIKATLAPSPQRDLTFDWRRDEFAALRSASASSTSTSGLVEVYPGLQHARDGWIDYEVAAMLSFSPPSDDPQTPLVRTLTHGTAYPTDWEPITQVTQAYDISLSNHDGSRTILSEEAFEAWGPASALASRPIQPLISLPRDFQVDGQPALPPRILASATPRLTWEAPALGSPSHYVLLIGRLNPLPRNFTSTVARIYLDADQRSVRIPPGVLLSGQTYLLRLTAFTREGSSPEVMAPRYFNLPFGTAQTTSGLLTVP
ncbi:hypothetical protein ATI61_107508 [Archangium gephyra]|uniref:Bacterial Ig-like domain protein n=1 Tax=Archangium gephyra TaxID=48 RepID=A0AAC8QI49_9BACT|nr:fibronectin type III domain-containing protein [Archangium gephyra]AKJ08073.1 Putative Bacterial Ig-like domain protein [Archangium gephyra]REG29811.1 hypothetical protein ATI61_107508 [Archangium gephyra]